MLPLCFVDETEHGDRIEVDREEEQEPTEFHSDSNKGPKSSSLSPATSSSTAARLTMQTVHSDFIPANLELLGSPDSSSSSRFTNMMMRDENEDSVAPIGHPTVPTLQPVVRGSGPQTHSPLTRMFTTSPLWPQENYKTAFLLRYYVENIASMFDICDNARHFARIVPLRAAHCPALFNAILCVSSRRLNKIEEYDHHVAEHYHQQCLEHLIPALSDPCAILDENLLAAIIILRYVEEIGMTPSDEITESHLLGARAFLATQRNMDLNGLGLASFWVAMRQEIYMGFVHNRTVDSSFFVGNLSPLLEPVDDDCNYANRIIFHCLTCLRYCYGDEERSISKWENLNDCLESLWSDKPQCFEPLWSNWANGAFFPELWYLNDAVTTGIQHYHLARVLLSAHSPKIPRLGPRQTITLRALEEDIKTTVREVCGVAIVGVPPNILITILTPPKVEPPNASELCVSTPCQNCLTPRLMIYVLGS